MEWRDRTAIFIKRIMESMWVKESTSRRLKDGTSNAILLRVSDRFERGEWVEKRESCPQDKFRADGRGPSKSELDKRLLQGERRLRH